MRPVLSFLFWAFLGLSSAPLFLGALFIFLLTLPFDRNGRLLHLYSCAWAQLYFAVNPFWRIDFEGREKLPWRGPAVLVANHESLGDILVLFGLYRPFKWVSKRSVFNVPFNILGFSFGQLMYPIGAAAAFLSAQLALLIYGGTMVFYIVLPLIREAQTRRASERESSS